MPNPIDNFEILKEDLNFCGKDLNRPECILAKKDGSLWISDARGGVTKIHPDGIQELIIEDVNYTTSLDKKQIVNGSDLPNGLQFTKDGNILIANFGKNIIEILNLSNRKRTILFDSIEGESLGKVNFVLVDSKDRIWVTVSTRHENWIDTMKPNIRDGYIALIDGTNIRIVADGFSITNEIRLDKNEEYLYISETCGRCINRMKVLPDGSLTNREKYGPTDLGIGGFPDGITFDAYGNLWGTLVFGEKIFAITPEGDLRIIFNNCKEEAAKRLDEAFFSGNFTEDLMLATIGDIAPMMTSIAFGGVDGNIAYIGSVLGKSIPFFKSPVSGLLPRWW